MTDHDLRWDLTWNVVKNAGEPSHKECIKLLCAIRKSSD